MPTNVEKQEVRLELTGLRQIEAGLQRLVGTIDQKLSGVHAVTNRLGASMTGLVAKVGLAVGALAGGAGFTALVTAGLKFNSTVENARLGIAAVQKQFDPERFKTFADAIAVSGQAIDLLKEKAKVSPATFEQLVEGFQSVTGPATAAGIAMKDQVDLVVLMSQALAGLGIRSEQLIQESRALITGNINADAAAAKILNITAEDIRNAKEAGTLFEFLTGKLKAFEEAGKLGATSWSTLWSNLQDGLTQAAGTATMPLFEVIKSGLEAIVAFDWEGAGKMAAGYVDAVIAAWREGRLDEIIVLTVRAGWEMVSEWIGANVQKLFNSAAIMEGITRASVTIGMALVRGIVGLLIDGLTLGIEAWVGSLLQQMALFTGAWSMPIRKAIAEIGEQFLAATVDMREGSKKALDGIEEGLRKSLGIENAINEATGEEITARQQLLGLINKSVGVREKEATAAKAAAAAVTEQSSKATKKPATGAGRLTAEEAAEARRAAAEDRGLIDSDFRSTAQSKRGMRIAALRKEIALADAQEAGLLDASRAPGLTNEDRDALIQGSRSARSEGRGLRADLRREEATVDPNSFADEFDSKLTEIEERMGTFAENIADMMGSVIGGAVDGIAGSIEGIIKGTMDWGDALRNVASSILNAVISAIAQMFAQWIVKMTLLNALEALFSTQRKARTATEIPGNVANSAAAAGGSWGMSSIIGLVAFVALMGAAMAMGGAFAKGGRPPVGRVSLVGEEGPELFVPDQPGTILTNRITNRIVGAIASPSMTEGDQGRGVGAGGSRTASAAPGAGKRARDGSMNVVMVDNRNQARDFLAGADGEAVIVDIVRRNAVRVGIPS